MRHKNTIILIAVVLAFLIGAASYLFLMPADIPEVVPIVTEEIKAPVEPAVTYPVIAQVGSSVEGRPIETYTFGNGDTQLLFVGGIHGGYEWNSVLLAYSFIDHFTDNPALVPETLTVTIIPAANPDGIYDVLGVEGRFTQTDALAADSAAIGRFNANDVDLNRNFDCKWQPTSSWRGNTVSAGTAPFSEPEALAIKNVVTELNPAAVVFWHSQADAVYASECENGILPGTLAVMNTYATAAEYASVDTFDAYPVTGDAEGWLASIGIPAVTVELSTHETIEWVKNLKGVQAMFGLYDQPTLSR